MSEDFVTFEIAKKLKEKGFDWENSPFYSEQDIDEWRYNNSYEIPNPTYNKDIPFDSETQTIVAPHISIQMAMKWLREKGIIITIIYTEYLLHRIGPQMMFGFNIQNIQGDLLAENTEVTYCSYEQATLAGIEYVLDNLI